MSKKRAVRLTESVVNGLASDGRDRLISDSMEHGFFVRVTPDGSKLFVARAWVDGRYRKITVGRHPTMSVADARKEARTALDDLRAGKSPEAEKATREAARAAGAVTVGDLADRWMREIVEPMRKPLTIRDYKTLVDKHVKPKFGRRLVASIKHGDVVSWHAEGKATPRQANYRVACLRAILNFAERLELRPPASNPCKGVEFYPERLVERFLSDEELSKVATAIDDCERAKTIGPFAAAGLRLALLTGARSAEIVGLRWEHIDFSRRVARLPDSKTGAKNLHLSPAAVEVLKTVPRVGPWVIAGADPAKPYVRLGHAWERVRATIGLDDIRLHDLRHTFASVAAAKGLSLPMIGKLLGHKVPATTQRYAHLAVDVTTEANDAVGSALTAAMTPKKKPPTANVIPLKRGRSRRFRERPLPIFRGRVDRGLGATS